MGTPSHVHVLEARAKLVPGSGSTFPGRAELLKVATGMPWRRLRSGVPFKIIGTLHSKKNTLENTWINTS